MGDAVNLSARLMAKAETGHIYATADVLDRSNTLFETTELAPFSVKGKAQPVQAWALGRARGSRTRQESMQQLPLIGRVAELSAMRQALGAVRDGNRALDRYRGEAGVGKTRLLEALREESTGCAGSVRYARRTLRRHRTRSGASSCASSWNSDGTFPTRLSRSASATR